MPNFGVGDVPVQISQTGTQEALIKNVGNETLFLDQYSSVSSANHGLSLAPFSSVNWAEGRDLWAVTAPGTATSVTVLYGATGTSLSEVSAVVTGDVTATIDGPVNANITNASIPVTGTVNANVTNAVIPVNGTVNANIQNASIPVTGTVNANITNANIDATITGDVVVTSGQVNVGGILTPVQVQGGGAILHSQSGVISPGGSVTVNIPAPANGLTYPGLGIIVTNTSKTVSNDVPISVYVYNSGFATGSPTRFQAGTVQGEAGEFGATAETSVVVPVGAAFPIRIDLDHEGAASTLGYKIVAVGLSYANGNPSEFAQWENGAEADVSFSNVLAGTFASIAAGFARREFLLISSTGTVGNFFVDILVSDGTWSIAQERAHNTLYGGAVGGSNVAANTTSLVTIPGDGRIHRVRANNATTGIIGLSYIGRANG